MTNDQLLVAAAPSAAVARWHWLMIFIAAINLALWTLCAFAVDRSSAGHAVWLQLWLSAAYVGGCAFRSVLPVYDIPRVVLIDSGLSSVLVGRSVATVAELSFALQWALLLSRLAPAADALTIGLSWSVVALIVVAEGCSWYAVLTTGQRGHIIENSLWGLSAALTVTGILRNWFTVTPGLHPWMLACGVGGVAYITFIVLFDVPMYWSRWHADQASGVPTLSLMQGLKDCWSRRCPSYRWEDWRTEVLWMTLYFVFGVWSSISVVYAALTLTAR